jgi:hypothetical protein
VVGLAGLLTGASAQPPPEPAVVAGTVRGPEGPLPEGAASVILTQEKALEGEVANWSEKQTLQAEGRFQFPKVPPGEYKLEITAEGFAERILGGLVVGEGKTYDWDLRVTPPTVVRGRILRADETPMVNTQVQLQTFWRGRYGNSSTGQPVTTDAEGRYELSVDGDRGMSIQITLIQPGEGYAFTPLLSPGETQEGLDLRLRPGYTLMGVAREVDTRAPIPDLSLSLKPLAYLEDMAEAGWNSNRATTDAAGTFTFPNLPPGVYEVSTQESYAGVRRVLVFGEEGKPIPADLELQRLPQPMLTVRLHKPDATPLAEARVQCNVRHEQRHRGGSSSGTSGQSFPTDAEGRLKIPLSGIATYRLTLTVPGYRQVSLENIFFFGDLPGPELEVTLQE